jgi:O-antigen/teichoic acid export membrane protein
VGWILLIIIEAPNAAKIFVDNPNAEVVSLLRWLALANLLQMLTSNFGILLQATLRESVVARFTAISYLVYMFLLSFFGLGNWKIGYIGISLFISQIILLIAYVFKYGRRGLKL